MDSPLQLETRATVQVANRVYTVEAVTREGDIALATLRGPRKSFTGIRVPVRVAGRPNAETWSVINDRGKEVACFAIDGEEVLRITR